MGVKFTAAVALALLIGAIPVATASSADAAPVAFTTDVGQVALPEAPQGYVWQRLQELQVALIMPPSWKRYAKRTATSRTVAFSPQDLDQNGQFETGLTAAVLWHPGLRPGAEQQAMEEVLRAKVRSIEGNKADNTVLRATRDERAGKPMLILRHRNAPTGLTPIIVHTILIGDPRTGYVYQFIFESPEARWDEDWKTADPILRRILVMFQLG